MRLPTIICALLAWAGVVALAQEKPAPVEFRTYRKRVMVWVPPYNTGSSKEQLRTKRGEIDPAAVLTHVALQFWAPTRAGQVVRVSKYDLLSDDLVAEWREWAHAHGLRVLLCVYNGVERWDWGQAVDAFDTHRADLVRALVTEMEQLQFDGIDIDFEGNGTFEKDKGAYLSFIRELSGELRQRHKQLYVDSFAYIWNAPNQHWWKELFPLVDGVTSMGYEETGAGSEGWRGYATQAAAAGDQAAAKLLLGLPTHLVGWQDKALAEHLKWFAQPETPGVALWEAQFKAKLWETDAPWKLLGELNATKP